MNNLHFISGLPRSGSTLLSTILRQNPLFSAEMRSPVDNIFKAIEDSTSKKNEGSVFITEQHRDNLLRGIFEIYHLADKGKTVFDTSRMWTARMSILCKIFPKAKFICCVRELGWIIDSFERIYRRNGMKPSPIYNYDNTGTVYTRSSIIAASNGVVGFAYDALKEGMASEYKNKILIVDYEDLCKDPEKTINGLYNFIGEEQFKHDFSHVEYNAGEFDMELGVKGLHDISGAVTWRELETILPFDLFNRFAADNFWRVNAIN